MGVSSPSGCRRLRGGGLFPAPKMVGAAYAPPPGALCFCLFSGHGGAAGAERPPRTGGEAGGGARLGGTGVPGPPPRLRGSPRTPPHPPGWRWLV